MSIMDSICLTVSSATPTKMMMVVPPSETLTGKNHEQAMGKMAIKTKNQEPKKVILLRIREIYSDVGRPGRMPGTKPPFFLRLLAISTGL